MLLRCILIYYRKYITILYRLFTYTVITILVIDTKCPICAIQCIISSNSINSIYH